MKQPIGVYRASMYRRSPEYGFDGTWADEEGSIHISPVYDSLEAILRDLAFPEVGMIVQYWHEGVMSVWRYWPIGKEHPLWCCTYRSGKGFRDTHPYWSPAEAVYSLRDEARV